MKLTDQIKILTDGETLFLKKSTLYSFIHSLFIGSPSGVLLIILWELFDPAPDLTTIYVTTGSLFLMMIIQFFVAHKSMIYSNSMAYNIAANVRIKLGNHLKKLSMGFFKKKDPGDITSVLLQDIASLEYILSHSIPNVYSAIFLPVIMAVFLFWLNWQLSLAILASIPAYIPFLFISRILLDKFGKKHIDLRNKVGSRFLEYLQGIKYIKSFNMGGEKFSVLDDSLKKFRDISIKLEAFPGATGIFGLAILEMGYFLAVSLGMYYLFGGTLTTPVLIAFLIIGYRFYEPIKTLTTDFLLLQYMKKGIDRITDVLNTETLSEPVFEKKPEDFSIEFENVSFKYTDTTVLKNVSFKVPEKSMTALVGPSGSGKTTITSLIARFWEANEGEVKIGNVPLQKMSTDLLYSNISEVFQEVYLFNDTIFNNIKIGKPDATDEEIYNAAKKAQCDEFIVNLPEGYDTLVGEGGSRLSGGEKQRISIARALLKDAPIILLDEATSSLDPENELYIQKAIREMVQEKTLVVIAHKLSTIKNADQILVLDNGKIIERGKHSELLNNNNLYSKLWNLQQESKGWKFTEPAKHLTNLSFQEN
ncbi:MAG: ABC transporter ATP-binding protein [Rhodothermaceae bacterium]